MGEATGTDDRQCIKRFAINAEKIVKYRLSRQVISRFIAATVLRARAGQTREDPAEKDPTDLVPAIEKCTERLVIHVESSVKFRSNLRVRNRFIAVPALEEEEKIQVLATPASSSR